MAKRTPGQLPLDAAAPKRKGTVERYAEADLAELRRASSIPNGMKALEAAYRLIGREIDRAETEQDRYGKINATRELRSLRERLGVVAPVPADGDAEEFWRTVGRSGPTADPATPGDPPPP